MPCHETGEKHGVRKTREAKIRGGVPRGSGTERRQGDDFETGPPQFEVLGSQDRSAPPTTQRLKVAVSGSRSKRSLDLS